MLLKLIIKTSNVKNTHIIVLQTDLDVLGYNNAK